MGQKKVRCQTCGAKNTDEQAKRCRICRAVLPDADTRGMQTSEGAPFSALVEGELDRWRLYTESA
jgi:hypothetical protein